MSDVRLREYEYGCPSCGSSVRGVRLAMGVHEATDEHPFDEPETCADTWHDVQDVGEGVERVGRGAGSEGGRTPRAEAAGGTPRAAVTVPSPTTTETGELVERVLAALDVDDHAAGECCHHVGCPDCPDHQALDALQTLQSRIEELEAEQRMLHRVIELHGREERGQRNRIEELERERPGHEVETYTDNNVIGCVAYEKYAVAMYHEARNKADAESASLQEARGLLERLVEFCDNCGGTGFVDKAQQHPCRWCSPARTFLSSTKETE